MLTPEILQFTFIIWILFGAAVFFTRAGIRRVAGALPGGVIFALLLLALGLRTAVAVFVA